MMVAKQELKAEMVKIANDPIYASLALPKVIGEPYDPERKIDPIIGDVFNVETVEVGQKYYYYVPGAETKSVYAVVNGAVTQTNVVPETDSELTIDEIATPEYYIYLGALSKANYGVLLKKRKNITEALNRKETKIGMDLLIAAAVSEGNSFTLDSGDTRLTYEKVISMMDSLELYGTKLALITGTDCTKDVKLMDYYTNKERKVSIEDLGIKHYPVPAFTYSQSGTQRVLAANQAILVGLSDSEDNKCGDFVRQKLATETGDAHRAIINKGALTNVGAARKLAYTILGFEMCGAVVKNPKVVGEFKRT